MGKVTASIADQGAASSSNFVLNVLLARWLPARDYGVYSVCWSLLLVLAGFHNALVLEPMTIVGPADYRHRLPAYLYTNRLLNWWVSLALSGAALVIALLYRQPEARSALFLLAVCLPGYLLLLLARRGEYVLNRPARALRLSLIYALLLFAVIFGWRASGRLSALTALTGFGVAGLASYWALAPPAAEKIHLSELTRAHWRYGKWLLASAIMSIGAPDLQTLLLSTMVDLKSAGALRALMNFVLPLSQLTNVLSVYALPRLAERLNDLGRPQLLRKGLLFSAGIAVLSAVYLSVLLLLAPWLEQLLYKGKMHAYLPLLPLLAAGTFIICAGSSFSTLLRAARNSQHQFFAGLAGTGAGIVTALHLIRPWGLAGALWGMLAANLATSSVILATFLWLLRRRHA